MYKTSGTLTLKTLMSIRAYYIRKMMIFIRVIEAILIILGIYLFCTKRYLWAICMAVLFAVYLILDIRRRKKAEDTYRSRLIENGEGKAVRYSSEIGKDGIRLSNDSRNLSTDFPFSIISSAVCFEDLIVFTTKGKQMLFAFPKQLTGEEQNDLLALLSGQGIRVIKSSRSVL